MHESVTPRGDPVAKFHLGNGARLERLNWAADLSRKGLKQSLGLMVNYLYDLHKVEDNHEAFVHGEVVSAARVTAAACSAHRRSRPITRQETSMKPHDTALRSSACAALARWPRRRSGARRGRLAGTPVTIIVPFPAGGGTDAFARPLIGAADQAARQPVRDRQQGRRRRHASAPTLAAHAAPDGYTFFMGAVHHTIAPAMYPKLDYNLETDFVPVGAGLAGAAGDRRQPAARAGRTT